MFKIHIGYTYGINDCLGKRHKKDRSSSLVALKGSYTSFTR